jgi:alpha-ketoglutarate-dependent 2,4-dichlorophenoxyacetate dioxygenase
LSTDTVNAIEAGMDRYAVVVFRDQAISDDQQLQFSRYFEPIESSIGGNITRLGVNFADVSNLDQNPNIYARDDRW